MVVVRLIIAVTERTSPVVYFVDMRFCLIVDCYQLSGKSIEKNKSNVNYKSGFIHSSCHHQATE